MSEKASRYYVVYPDPTTDRVPSPFPSALGWEAFDNIDDARRRAQELDKGWYKDGKSTPPRDLVVIKGELVGFISGDAYDAEFLDGPKEKA